MQGYVDEADLESSLEIAVTILKIVLKNPQADDVAFNVQTALDFLEPFV